MSEQIITKRCSKCKQIKPFSEFYKDRRNKDGLQSYCNSCRKAYKQSERGKAANRKADAKYRKTPNGKAAHRKGEAKYKKTPKGKAAKAKYRQSPKGKASRRKEVAKYRQSPNGKATMKRFNARHPNNVRAKNAVNNAIRDGRLPRPDTRRCHCCPNPAQQYHHWYGYKPEHWLDVVPVCKKCHSKIHK